MAVLTAATCYASKQRCFSFARRSVSTGLLVVPFTHRCSC